MVVLWGWRFFIIEVPLVHIGGGAVPDCDCECPQVKRDEFQIPMGSAAANSVVCLPVLRRAYLSRGGHVCLETGIAVPRRVYVLMRAYVPRRECLS